MIQRIQSVFLLFAIISATVLFFIQLKHQLKSTTEEQGVSETITVCYISKTIEGSDDVEKKPLYISALLNSFLIVIALFTIFLYKKRTRQSLFCRLGILTGTGLLVYLLFFLEKAGGTKNLIGNNTQNYLFLILPALTVLFFYLSNVFIMRDERLIRSVDRIR